MPLTSRLGFAGLIELVAGALFIVGFKTRSVAFIISGEMAVAYVLGSLPERLLATQQLGRASSDSGVRLPLRRHERRGRVQRRRVAGASDCRVEPAAGW